MTEENKKHEEDITTCPFHTRLVLLIHKKGLSCKEVAYRLEVALDTVYHWTCGRRWPDSPQKIVKLAEILEVTCDQLLTGKGL